MVRHFLLGSFCIALFALTTACESSKSKSSGTTPPATTAAPDWSSKMHALSRTLSELMPIVASHKRFNDPKNDAVIEADTKALTSLAHSLKTGNQPSADPSMRIMSGLFEEDIARALDALKTGNRDYARHILKDTTSYCIQCHTQTNNGPDFPRLSLDINTNDLAPLDRAEFYAATRQFDSALSSYVQALDDPKLASADPFEWESAARSALAITVRVKQNAKDTRKLLNSLKKNTQLPKAQKRSLAAWDKSVVEWSKEKPKDLTKPSLLLAEAESLIHRAQKGQEFPLDHTQDIVYFRAASLLHELLQQPPTVKGQSDELRARALYWAGVASEATRDMNFWTLHETFYEQCIRLRPETEQARQCFARLKDSITIGYTGSAGTFIPPEVSRRLETFRRMADGVPTEMKSPSPSPSPTP